MDVPKNCHNHGSDGLADMITIDVPTRIFIAVPCDTLDDDEVLGGGRLEGAAELL
ncbi:hypothetical protein WOLCODRAFT_29547 [Wolfiporia cocos MD-104 SS10]|uniref:Uncharacterized protein n=1 Tax=Wolfiporia cocos (strain MD-104) TaxID=742152 RepID=A0A2H3JRX9_WOLCO|nr:hypothetical protein WOLCODRAFT_29547 [Wolfiporia cocos MD-104 SS10]